MSLAIWTHLETVPDVLCVIRLWCCCQIHVPQFGFLAKVAGMPHAECFWWEDACGDLLLYLPSEAAAEEERAEDDAA